MERRYEVVKAHLEAAKAYAQLSRAQRLKVGAVIVRANRIVSIGYNGTPTGRDNSCEEAVPELDLLDQVKAINYVTKPEVIHAEANAILFAAKEGIKTDGCDLITTHSPCFECSKMIVQSGISNLYYEEEYRDLEPLAFLEECGVKTERTKNEEENRTTN